MISELLDYSRKNIDQHPLEAVDSRELVAQITHLLFPPRHIDIRILEPMPILQTRRLKLQQVFQNLISNAVKYSDKTQGYIEIGSEDNGEYVQFFVKDNGPGITSDEQATIFDLFKRGQQLATSQESSTGVGLNILKMLVEEQGGSIRLESEPGRGSTFFFDWKK